MVRLTRARPAAFAATGMVLLALAGCWGGDLDYIDGVAVPTWTVTPRAEVALPAGYPEETLMGGYVLAGTVVNETDEPFRQVALHFVTDGQAGPEQDLHVMIVALRPRERRAFVGGVAVGEGWELRGVVDYGPYLP